jgi:hypothetical protein
MSLQANLDKVETKIDEIRFDPKYLHLKNKKRSEFDTNRYTKYTRQLTRLEVQKKNIIKQMRTAGLKPNKRESEPSTRVESKPAWRNQHQKVARRNQDDGKIARNWVRERKETKEVAAEFPGKRNALVRDEPDQVTVNYRKTSKTPARTFVKRMLYHKPVVRNASQMARLKEEGNDRIERRMHPVNGTVRAKPQRRTMGETQVVKQVHVNRQPRKSRAATAPAPRKGHAPTPPAPEPSNESESGEFESESAEFESQSGEDEEIPVTTSGEDDNIEEDSEELLDDLSN